MINSHQFQQAAKQFRAGRISLKEFTDFVIDGATPRKPNEDRGKSSAQLTAPDETPNKALQQSPSRLPKRSLDSHKGDFGRVVVIGGSAGMAGAIGLTGLAILRSGSGLVKVVVPDSIQSTVASVSPCLMTIGCPVDGKVFHNSAKECLVSESKWADVVALGPGLGRAESLQSTVGTLYQSIEQPMVIDADGLNVLVDAKIDLSNHQGQRVLTPHPGEFQRLAGTKITNRSEMEDAARKLAADANVTIVLKGNKTFVTDGAREFRNDTGNPGMATAGSGDVLTGVITSLVGQGLSTFDASVLGVHVHGLAGDIAAEEVGETSLIATDIIEFLPFAFKKHAHSEAAPIGF